MQNVFCYPIDNIIFGSFVTMSMEIECDSLWNDLSHCFVSFHSISSFTTKSTGSKTIRSLIQFYDLCPYSFFHSLFLSRPPLRPCCYFRSFSHNKSSQQCCNHNACILHTQFSTTSIDYSYFCYIGMSTHSLCVCGRLFSVQMLYMSMKHVYFKHPHIYSFTLTRK